MKFILYDLKHLYNKLTNYYILLSNIDYILLISYNFNNIVIHIYHLYGYHNYLYIKLRYL